MSVLELPNRQPTAAVVVRESELGFSDPGAHPAVFPAEPAAARAIGETA
jgi:hypothetical protein